eukprot:TRINITY_DN1960_c0_g2_i1.p1 TRINITY_DN1960_c0_g2~~TRINITY_DN1960_c0_g2_i1.p1  ORF type:complete len:249 (-),score=26.41 TRINITY_DN1960_c0_g2_i1:183-929(-)
MHGLFPKGLIVQRSVCRCLAAGTRAAKRPQPSKAMSMNEAKKTTQPSAYVKRAELIDPKKLKVTKKKTDTKQNSATSSGEASPSTDPMLIKGRNMHKPDRYIPKSHFVTSKKKPLYDLAAMNIMKQSMLKDVIQPGENKELLERAASLRTASPRELLEYKLKVLRTMYQRVPTDCGSPEVQAVTFHERVRNAREHLRTHRQDKHAKRNFLVLLSKRRKLFLYLKRTNYPSYAKVLKECSLSDAEFEWQ